ncbi:hypothetical protein NQZ68_038660 [Dissostichus eleginoides]|nr:hypothetical protein NQZ68_038660 [Dissostichus eleginoides]
MALILKEEQHIPFHLLHVSALLWLDVYTAGAKSNDSAAWVSNESPFGEFHWPPVLLNSKQLEIVPLSRWLKQNPCGRGLKDCWVRILIELLPELLLWLEVSEFWAGKLCLWHQFPHSLKFKVSGPVAFPPSSSCFSGSHTTRVITVEYQVI